jgi:hypothetical protein
LLLGDPVRKQSRSFRRVGITVRAANNDGTSVRDGKPLRARDILEDFKRRFVNTSRNLFFIYAKSIKNRYIEQIAELSGNCVDCFFQADRIEHPENKYAPCFQGAYRWIELIISSDLRLD